MQPTEIFPWNENFATGIALIDEQHRQLVFLLNKLANHLAHRSDLGTLAEIFDELAEYTHYHFQAEETIWNRYFEGDPWLNSHKATHAKFFESVLNLKAAERSKPFDAVVEGVLSFLTQWLAYHILDTDMRMAKVVKGIMAGLNIEAAKRQAELEMEGAMRVLIHTILQMYETLSSRTLQLSREIRERIEAEMKLKLSEVAFETTKDAICILDADFRVVKANAVFSQGFGPEQAVLGLPLHELKSGFREDLKTHCILDVVGRDGHWCGEVASLGDMGVNETEWLTLSSVKNQEGHISNYVAVFSNVRQLLRSQRNLHQLAHHDALTGLPNRLLLSDRLSQAMTHARRSRSQLAVCYVDLDEFKSINDRHGHAVGDLVLKEVAKRLTKVLRSGDTVARVGGDEFVVLLGDLKTEADCTELLDRALSAMRRPLILGEVCAEISASIGYVWVDSEATDVQTLLGRADFAMYEAKRQGKARHFGIGVS